MLKLYILNLLIALDQGVNAIFGGSPDMCISTRLYLNYPNSIFTKTVNCLFMNPNHCKNSAKDEEDPAVFK